MKIKFVLSSSFLAITLAAVGAQNLHAQEASAQPSSPQQQPTPTVVLPETNDARPIARGNNLYCAGYIQTDPINESVEVVGGREEQEQNVYTQNNFIYINAGADKGVKVNDRYIVTRPRGRFRSTFSKKGQLGIYVQEVGTVRVVNVKPQVSIAVVDNSCETVLLGDLLTPFTSRTPPNARENQPFDIFRDSNGKAIGRIVMARDNVESPSRDQIVYVDLGAEDNVKAGDYLTIYRPLGTGNVARPGEVADEEVVRPEDYGSESLRFRGGKFSIQAPRRKGANAEGRIATQPNVKKRRPDDLRKVVGEMVILNVQQRTATAIITRTAQEIHTGDHVELQ